MMMIRVGETMLPGPLPLRTWAMSGNPAGPWGAAGERDRVDHVDVVVARQQKLAAGEQAAGVKAFAASQLNEQHVAIVEHDIFGAERQDSAWHDGERNADDRPAALGRQQGRIGAGLQLLEGSGRDAAGSAAKHPDFVVGVFARQSAGLGQRVEHVVFERRQFDRVGRAAAGDQRAVAGFEDRRHGRGVFPHDDDPVQPLADQRDINLLSPRLEQVMIDRVRPADESVDLGDRQTGHCAAAESAAG